MALRLGAALWGFWFEIRSYQEGWNFLERALEGSEEVAVSVRAKALEAAGNLAGLLSRNEQAEALCQESLALFRAIGDTKGMATVVFHLAIVAQLGGDFAAARSRCEERITLNREVGNEFLVASTLDILAEIDILQGEFTRARPLMEESQALYKSLGNTSGVAWRLLWSAILLYLQGDLVRARAVAEECLIRGKGVNNNLSFLDIPPALEGLAAVVAAQGEPTWAARLWGTAETQREAYGIPLAPVYRTDYEQAVAAARTQLGEKAFAAAWAEGGSMTPEQALADRGALIIPVQPQATGSEKSLPAYPDGLTAREVEVLRLVAQGLSNAEIAEQLIISLLTVKAHMRSLYNKLGISSRSAATRYAIEHHLM